MKKKQLAFVIALLTMLPGITLCQTINLNVEKNGQVNITLDDEPLLDEGKINIDVPFKGEIKFSLNKKAAVNLKISLRPKDELLPKNRHLPKLLPLSLESVFNHAKLISTDANLNLSVSGRTENINRPFAITILDVGNASNSFTAIFVPRVETKATTNNDIFRQASNGFLQSNQNGINPEAKPTQYHPGSAVYDALTLSHPETLTDEQFLKIISAYFSNVDSYATIQTLVGNADTGNPFLDKVFTDDYNKFRKEKIEEIQSGSSISSILSMSSIGGLDITNYADGLAKFLVKRTKQELSSTFFVKLKEKIDGIEELKALLPKTTVLLYSVDEQIYNYQQYLQNLRAAFKTDLDALDTNLPNIKTTKRGQAYFIDKPALSAAIDGGCYIVGGLKKQLHPGDLLANYPIKSLENLDKSWTGAFQTVQLLSQSLRDTASKDGGYWVDVKYIRQLMADKETFRIYLGLLYQQGIRDFDYASFSDNTSFLTLLDNLAANYDNNTATYNAYKQYIQTFGQKISTLNQLIKIHEKPASDSLLVEQYKKYFDASMDLIKFSADVADLPLVSTLAPQISTFKDQVQPYFNITENIAGLATEVNRKNYAAAINQVLAIYDEVYTKQYQAQFDAAKKASEKVKPDDSLARQFTEAKEALNKVNNERSDIARYGGFVAVLASAKSSDEVETAIEAFVLPPGSSSVKRESVFNVALNAYTGLFYGHEQIRGVKNGSPWLNSYGLTAPVGVSISFGQRQFFWPFSGKGHSSVSVFLSLIDIGAVAAYRFKDDQTDQVPTIKLKDIFSPGAFLSFGIPKTPLSINWGVQTGPTLRKIIKDNSGQPVADSDSRLYWRFSASLVVDLPLLNFYTKSR